jgi:hypothetical protein
VETNPPGAIPPCVIHLYETPKMRSLPYYSIVIA